MSSLALPAAAPPSARRRTLGRAARLAPLFVASVAAMAGAYAAGVSARRAAERLAPVVAASAASIPPEAPAYSLPAAPLRGALADARDLECLTQAVYYEARGEPEAGQAAVAQVVLNRTRAGRWPRSVCGVVFQHARMPAGRTCQFSFACDPALSRPRERAAWARAERVARAALAGRRMAPVGAATQFRVAGLASDGLERVAQIGAHVFYRLGRRKPAPAPAPSP